MKVPSRRIGQTPRRDPVPPPGRDDIIVDGGVHVRVQVDVNVNEID